MLAPILTFCTYLSYTEAVQEVVDFAKFGPLVALAAVEIGGGNGMINMITGSELDIPVIDGDFMGRAYPTGWQVTMNVYDKGDKGEMLLPSAMASGDGSVVVSVQSRHETLQGGVIKRRIYLMC